MPRPQSCSLGCMYQQERLGMQCYEKPMMHHLLDTWAVRRCLIGYNVRTIGLVCGVQSTIGVGRVTYVSVTSHATSKPVVQCSHCLCQITVGNMSVMT